MRTAVVEIATGRVVNVIERGLPQPDAHSRARVKEATEPPKGFRWVAHEQAGVGWTLEGDALVAPPGKPAGRQMTVREKLEQATGLTIEQIKQVLAN